MDKIKEYAITNYPKTFKNNLNSSTPIKFFGLILAYSKSIYSVKEDIPSPIVA